MGESEVFGESAAAAVVQAHTLRSALEGSVAYFDITG